MKTADTTWTQAEWAAARRLAARAPPPDHDEVPLGVLLDELRAEAEQRRADRRKAMRIGAKR